MTCSPRLFRSLCAMALVVAAAAPLSAAAARRRAVKPPEQERANGTVKVTGTVRDQVTSEPIVRVRVSLGADLVVERDDQGQYTLTIPNRTTVLTAQRRGYLPTQKTYRPADGATVDFSMPETPTTRVRTTAGETIDLDYDSSQFQFVIPFSGSSASDTANLCRASGASFTPHKSLIRRITGPSTTSSVSECCKDRPVVGINFEMKSGEQTVAYFADSCFYDVAFLGIERRSGLPKFFDFKNVAEITFP